MRTWAKASRLVWVLSAASAAGIGNARAEDVLARPSANTAASVKQDTADPAADGDAVSAWLQGTLTRPEHAGRAEQRLPGDGSATIRRGSLAGRDSRLGTVQMLWPLLVVLAIIAGGAMAIRRLFPRSNRLGGGGVIDLLASHYLSSRQSLCLVRLGRRAVLLGVTPERIVAVMEITDPEELSDLVAAVERKRPNSFTSTFARFSVRDHGGRPDEGNAEGRGVIPTERLTKAGGNIRDLVGRIRSLSEAGESAEPT